MLQSLRALVTADGLTWAVTLSFWVFLTGSAAVFLARRFRGARAGNAGCSALPAKPHSRLLRPVEAPLSPIARRLLFWGVFVLAAALRLAFLAEWPKGLALDEASIGYEAIGILQTGMDRHGNLWPVYFVSWGGSGHSAAYVYLAALSFRLLGVSDFALRLPQALAALCALSALYFLGKKLRSPLLGLWLMLACALAPWHIMMSRWALDCYLFSSFFAVAFTLFVYAKEDARFWIPACAAAGITLYTYALSYLFMAIFLIGLLLVFWRTRGKPAPHPLRPLLLAGGLALLFVLALPLLGFTLVTLGALQPLRLGFLTIPAFTLSRAGEIGRDMGGNLRILLRLLLCQQEQAGNAFNIIPALGVTYLFLAPFGLVGLAVCLRAFWRCVRRGEEASLALFAVWFAAGFAQCVLVSCYNSWTANGLLLCVILLTALGAAFCCGCFSPKSADAFSSSSKAVPLFAAPLRGRAAAPSPPPRKPQSTRRCLPLLQGALGLWLTAGLLCFGVQYFFATASVSAIKHFDTMELAVARAQELAGSDKTVYVSEGAGGGNAYVYLCYYTQLPVDTFLREVRYGTPVDAWESVTDLGNWHFCTDGEDAAQKAGANAVFVLDVYQDNLPHFVQNGYTVENYGVMAVAYLP